VVRERHLDEAALYRSPHEVAGRAARVAAPERVHVVVAEPGHGADYGLPDVFTRSSSAADSVVGMSGQASGLRCECGREISPSAAGAADHTEYACACGRRHDLVMTEHGWRSVAQLTPERSVPLSGFSRELRDAPDSERYWFRFSVQGEVHLPVHVLISRSAARAEVKSGDQKVFAIAGAVTATEARRLWVAWREENRRGMRGRLPLFVPSRVGRLPHSAAPGHA
jgi:hypothetical protein